MFGQEGGKVLLVAPQNILLLGVTKIGHNVLVSWIYFYVHINHYVSTIVGYFTTICAIILTMIYQGKGPKQYWICKRNNIESKNKGDSKMFFIYFQKEQD